MARRDTSFYYAFLLLPRARRRAIIAVWDFFRAVDDAVDEKAGGGWQPEAGGSRLTAEEELARWRRELAAAYGDGQALTGQGQELAHYIRAFGLSRQPFEDVIDGVEMDLVKHRYRTFEELYLYCLKVASAVGLVCIEVFGYRNPGTRQYAIDLGVALQLTNIIRDLGRDLDAGRVYLPQEDLDRFGCTEDDLRQGVVSDRVRHLLEFESARAHQYYDKARAGLPRDDRRALVAARVMGAIYLDLLRRIEASDFDVFSRIIRAPRPRRAWIAGLTWAKTMMGR
jgi:phytoene synthase